jgi:MFS family permease
VSLVRKVSSGNDLTPRSSAESAFGPRFMAPMYMGAALNPINSSLIATAMVAIAASMEVEVGKASILVSALYLTCAIAQPVAGRLAEEFGPRRIFLAGILMVLAGGVVGGLAQSLATLTLARVLIGAGTSAAYPSAMLLIHRRAAIVGLTSAPGGVLGGMAVTSAATLAVGPTIGGLLVGWLDWRATFLVNVPVAIIAFTMARLWIERDSAIRSADRSVIGLLGRIDLPGITAFGASISSLLVFLMTLPAINWVALGICIAGAAVLVAYELRADSPFIDFRLLASNGLMTRTFLRYALTLMGIYVVIYGFTQWMIAARGLSPMHAGLALLPMGVLSAIIARVVSRSRQLHLLLAASAVCLILGAAAVILLDSESPLPAVVLVTSLFGLVAGCGNVTNQAALYLAAPAERLGTAAGLLRTFGYIGSISAACLTGYAFRSGVDDAGLRLVGVTLVVIGAVVLALTVFDRELAALARR